MEIEPQQYNYVLSLIILLLAILFFVNKFNYIALIGWIGGILLFLITMYTQWRQKE